jgi:hypothetical protein
VRGFEFRQFTPDVYEALGASAKQVALQPLQSHSEDSSISIATGKRLALQTKSVALQLTNARKIRTRLAAPPQELEPNVLTPAS